MLAATSGKSKIPVFRRGVQGFTLVELVIVIVLTGILAVGAVSFITRSVEGYVDTANRQQLANSALIAAEKISRALREALPNSIRLGTGCVEFIPILAASNYISVPTTAAANGFEAVGSDRTDDVTGRAVVYPASTTNLYNPSAHNSISGAIATYPAGADQVTVTLSGNHRFLTDSPTRRFYIVSKPIAYCQVGENLYRYIDYGFNSSTSLPPGGGVKDLLINRLASNSLSFNYTSASLVRNAVVNFDFIVTDGGDSYRVEQEVNIRNVP